MGFSTEHTMFPRLKRAALIVEMEDGTRLLYAMHSPVTMSVETEYDHYGDSQVLRTVQGRTFLEIRGEFTGGRIWKDEMPGEDQDEIEPRRQEIEG